MQNNQNNRVNVLGTMIDKLEISEANSKISSFISGASNKSHYVVKPYVEFLVKAQDDKKLQQVLNDADLVLADGTSVQWAASYLYAEPRGKYFKLPASLLFWIQNDSWRNGIIPAKMAGANQTFPLFKIAEQKGWKVGIIGGKDAVGRKKSIMKIFPKLSRLNVWSGYYDESDGPKLVAEIKAAKLDILFVATGFAKQELFIAKYLKENLATVLIGEGGTFDYKEFGGDVKRAPVWTQKIGLEWLWRLIIQPSRITRQIAVPKFIYKVRKQAKKL